MEIDGDALSKSIEGPEVLCMDKEAFTRLGRDMMIDLTKDLMANEWNKLLEKFWGETEDYGNNFSIIYYTLGYDEKKRLGMLEEGLKSNLEHLFVRLSDLAYVPRTPKVIKLLEQGLDVYPHLRHWILFTIYQLDYPTAKWHFDTTGEDVDRLRNLITMRFIKRAAVVSHVAEIATLYSPEIWNLLANNVLTMEDMFTMRLYCKVCGCGGKGYLEWVKVNSQLRPDQGCLDAAVSRGHENVIDYITKELDMQMMPSQKAVNKAASNGMLTLLVNKCSVWEVFPNTGGANEAAGNGRLEVLKWLATLDPEERAVYPTQYGANMAAINAHLDVLKWLATLEPEQRRVYPNQYGANFAAKGNHLTVLKWLAVERQVYPDQNGANQVAGSGQLKVLKWLAAERQVYPDQNGANGAAHGGQLKVLKWLAAERQTYPNQIGANQAAHSGKLKVLEWLAAERQVYPDKDGANQAALKGHLDVLKWLAGERRVYPGHDSAGWVAGKGHLGVLEWLVTLKLEYRVYPSQDGVNEAAKNGRLDVLKWLAEERQVYPNKFGADQAAMGGHLDVLKWLPTLEPEDRRVYPDQYSATLAIRNGHAGMIDWLKGRGVISS